MKVNVIGVLIFKVGVKFNDANWRDELLKVGSAETINF